MHVHDLFSRGFVQLVVVLLLLLLRSGGDSFAI
jgi:hypothetical protein